MRACGVAHAGTRGTGTEVFGGGIGCRLIADTLNGMCGYGEENRKYPHSLSREINER
jgi:hypothetical protein